LISQSLELFKFVLNRLDLYSNGADPAVRTMAGAHPSAAGSLLVPPQAVAGACLSAAVAPLRPRRARTLARRACRPRVVAARSPCCPPPSQASPPTTPCGTTPGCPPFHCSTPLTPLKWAPPPPAPPFPLLPHSLPYRSR
jgi:hypothetical protein